MESKRQISNQIRKDLKGCVPSYFGLGFIQCKISSGKRYHFYHPTVLPIVNIEEEIHDHRYDFFSTILFGSLENKIYSFTENVDGNYYKQYESCEEGKKSPSKITKGNIELLSQEIHSVSNGNYIMLHTMFHTVSAKLCVTRLNRSIYKKRYSNVIRPINELKICPFSLKLKESECWSVINDILDQMDKSDE